MDGLDLILSLPPQRKSASGNLCIIAGLRLWFVTLAHLLHIRPKSMYVQRHRISERRNVPLWHRLMPAVALETENRLSHNIGSINGGFQTLQPGNLRDRFSIKYHRVSSQHSAVLVSHIEWPCLRHTSGNYRLEVSVLEVGNNGIQIVIHALRGKGEGKNQPDWLGEKSVTAPRNVSGATNY
jgi:hypothetical protein